MSKQASHGIVTHSTTARRTDYLYRVSIKCLVRNDAGEVLVVKEAGRNNWDLPGGGMDHDEDIKTAIAREMKEEVALSGDFTYKVLYVENPKYLKTYHFWQIRLIFAVTPENMQFSPSEDSDEVAFINPDQFKDSASTAERCIYNYCMTV